VFKIVDGNSQGLPDVEWFVRLLGALPDALRTFFDTDRGIVVTRAPGRLDVMGGIADYSGSLVLEMPIAEATFAAIQKNSSEQIEVVSIDHDGERFFTFDMRLVDLLRDGQPLDLASARDFFAGRNGGSWASYVAGAFFVLAQQLGILFDSGARIVIASQVPVGKGVSSSAALEVAAMQAICVAYEIDIAALDLALLCQIVENRVVGAACGIMDQITSHCGEPGKLTSIVCQPAEIQGWLDIPGEVEFWGIDSGVRHAVSGSDYSSVRTGAFMGYRIIAELGELQVRNVSTGLVEIEDGRWHGYLANVTPDEYEKTFRHDMPDAMSGQEFLSRYQGITDTVTAVDPAKIYVIKAPAEHAIYENWRVHKFSDLLTASPDDEFLAEAGELMFASHESYKACGLTESRTDRIVELVRTGRAKGLLGARITGGGSGGTVVLLAKRGARKAVNELADGLADETGERPRVFHGSSPGCSLFGHLRLRRDQNAESC
jgi:galactokinase